MDKLPEILQSNQAIALCVAIIIFLITVFLASRKIIGLIATLTLLLIAIALSMFISNQTFFNVPSRDHHQQPIEETANFKAQILQVINNINSEISQEKESLKKVSDGVQSLISQVEAQKQKLQSFIEETRERFSKIKSDQNQEVDPHQLQDEHMQHNTVLKTPVKEV